MNMVIIQDFSLIIDFFNLVDQAYKAVIGVLWPALITYGLIPKYAFLTQFTSYSPYRNLENALIGGAFFQFSVLSILLATLSMLIMNSFLKPQTIHFFIYKMAVSVILASVSFIVTIWSFSELGSVYATIYNSAGINWSNFLLFSSGNYISGPVNPAGGGYSILIEAFTLTGYFTSIVSLFSILMLRQALLLFSFVVLPFSTIMMVFNKGRKFAERIWEIIIEMAAYPYFVLLSLYLGHLFSWDGPLQLAFLFLPSILPGYLFVSGRSFLSAPVLGFLSGMTMTNAVGRGIETAGIAAEFARGGAAIDTVKKTAFLPFNESTASGSPGHKSRISEPLPWKELINEELKFRKE